MAEQAAPGVRGSVRDTVYRRPPARPAPADPAWFAGSGNTTTGETPVVREPGGSSREIDPSAVTPPSFGPATPGGTSRASFGFTAGPISPVRHPVSPTSPAAGGVVGYDSPDLSRAATDSAAFDRPEAFRSAPAAPDPVRSATDPARSVPAGLDPVRSAGADPARLAPAGLDPVRSAPAGLDPVRSAAAGTDPARLAPAGLDPVRSAAAGADPARLAPAGLAPAGLDPARSGLEVRTSPAASDVDLAVAGRPDTTAERRYDTAERRYDTAERVFARPEPARGAPTGAPAPSAASRIPPADPPRQSRFVTVGVVLLSLIVLVVGSIVGVAYFSGSDDKLDAVLQLGAGENGERTVSAPLDNRTKASFELLAATNRVRITIGELGDDFFRISSPEDAGIAPSPVIRNDDVKLQVTRDGDGTGGEIEVVLSAKVRWQLRFSGYAEEHVVDLSGGQISGIEMVGGTRRAEVTLSRPAGTVPIKVTGAVETLILRSPSDSPVRVKVAAGAKTVVAGTRTLRNVAAGSTLTPKGWAVKNRYDVGAAAPITALTVESAQR